MPSVKAILAIEASQRTGGVAVRDPKGRVEVEWFASHLRYDDDLIPAIDRLYGRLGLAPEATGAVGVSIGPGGFTGLRIATSVAKMFAETLGAKIVAVPTALVAAESHEGPGPIIAALAAKKETIWSTRLERRGGAWAIVAEGLTDGLDLRHVTTVLADDHLPPPLRARCEAKGVPVISPIFDPQGALAVTVRWLQEGRTIDPLLLQPLYPRPPEAVALWERRHPEP